MTVSKLFILIAITLIMQKVHAQFEAEPSVENLTHVIKASPTASELGRYGDYGLGSPVGIPSINIPLTSIKGNTFEVPISLSYRGGGVKVNDISSWVGTGWSLNAGGVITRSINKRPDDMPYSLKDLYDTGFDPTNPSSGPSPFYLANNVNKLYDGEADVFTINALGLSGTFFFAQDANGNYVPHLMERSDIRIEYNESTDVFTIWDTNGVKYIFSEQEFSTSTTYIEGNFLNAGITAWYLTRIESQYESFDFEYQAGGTSNYQIGQTHVEFIALPFSSRHFFSNPSPSEPQLQIDKKYLVSIIASNGEQITFTRSNRSDIGSLNQLDYLIHTTGNASDLVVDFYTSDVNNRMFLDGVELRATGADTKEFSFEYNNETVLADRFGGQDFWGYNNGGSYTNPAIPTHGISGGDRDPDTAYVKAGTLEAITYPTGGTTEFVWESNQYNGTKTIDEKVSTELNYNENNWDENGEINSTFTVNTKSRIYLTYDIEDYQPVPHEPALEGRILFSLLSNGEVILESALTGDDFDIDLGTVLPGSYQITLENDLGSSNVFEFDFELKYDEPTGNTIIVPYNKTLGGLRIQSIINKDENGIELGRKTYEYPNPVAYDDATPQDFVEQVMAYELQNFGTAFCSIRKAHYAYKVSNNRLDGTPPDHPAIYSEITEYSGTPNENNGKIVKTFYTPYAHTSYPYSSPGFVYNTLRMQQVYDASNNEVRRTTYDYEFVNKKSITNLIAGFEARDGCEMEDEYSPSHVISMELFTLISRWKKLRSVETIEYLDGNELSSTMNYTYYRPNNHINPNEIQTLSSDGQSRKKITLFPDDFSGTSAEEVGLRNYFSGLPIETVHVVGDEIIKGRLNKYNSNGELLNVYETTYEEDEYPTNYTFSNGTTDPSANTGSFNKAAHYDNELVSMEYYDNRTGQVKHVIKNGITTAYLWGHNKAYPVCQISNIDLATIESIPGFSLNNLETNASEQAIKNELENIRNNTNSTQSFMGYIYEIGHGMKWSLDGNGRVTQYSYDGFGRLLQVRDDHGNILQEFEYNYGSN